MMQVRILRDGSEIQSFDLDSFQKESVVVGRDDAADVKLKDRAVGRRHVVFTLGTAGVSLHKQSEFGILKMNGVDVVESPVKSGDVLQLAGYEMRFSLKQGTPKSSNSEGDALSEEASAFVANASDRTPPTGTPVADIEVGASHEGSPVVASDFRVQSAKESTSATDEADGMQGAVIESSQSPDVALGQDPGITAEEAIPGEVSISDPGVPVGSAAEDKTAVFTRTTLKATLSFKPGEANVEEFVVDKPEISIGRGSACDILIEDKKSSRKHVVIEKKGAAFVLKDLGSANGTYVNGIKVTDQELNSDDVIRIGDTEFTFRATNQDYFAQESRGDFLASESASAEQNPGSPGVGQELLASSDVPGSEFQEIALDTPLAATVPQEMALAGGPLPSDPSGMGLGPQSAAQDGLGMGIPLSTPEASKKKQSLLEKFKALPPRRRLVVGIILVGLVFLFFELTDDESQKTNTKKAASKINMSDPKAVAFAKLPKEKQGFVTQSYDLALQYYTKQDFEHALEEIEKIDAILPNIGYKDSDDIKQYARRGQELLKAQQEEAKKREEEAKRQKQIAEYVAQAKALQQEEKFEALQELFVKILELDPENATVAQIKAEVAEKEARIRQEKERQLTLEHMRDAMGAVLKEAERLRGEAEYYPALDKLSHLADAGTDAALLEKGRLLESEIRNEIVQKRTPHFQAAQEAYDRKEYEKSRASYLEALKVDPKCQECRDGIERIQRDVHERAQKIYIEAILYESVSDLVGAKRKYLECFQASVPEDDYYGRCWRKYHRFTTIDNASEEMIADGNPSQGTATEGGKRSPASVLEKDHFTEEVMESF